MPKALRILRRVVKVLGGAVLLVALLVACALGYRAVRQHQRAAEMALRLGDLWAHGASQNYSGRVLYPEIAAYNAYAHGTVFETPVCVIQGDEDMQTPAVEAQAWFGRITAPSKHLTLLPGGGHRAIIAMPDQFLAALKTCVRPAGA